jgi:hypothetical protein
MPIWHSYADYNNPFSFDFSCWRTGLNSVSKRAFQSCCIPTIEVDQFLWLDTWWVFNKSVIIVEPVPKSGEPVPKMARAKNSQGNNGNR